MESLFPTCTFSHKPSLFPALHPIYMLQQQSPRCSLSKPEPWQQTLARMKVHWVLALQKYLSPPSDFCKYFKMLMGSTHPQPRGRLQNRALCVPQISSRRILLGAWVLSHPRALAGVLQPWIVEVSLPAHSFLVTEVRWMVDRKVAPSYKTERALSCSEVSKSKRAPLSITEIRFWNVYFAFYPSCLFSFFFVFFFFFSQFNTQA